jgi:hypothetical protein
VQRSERRAARGIIKNHSKKSELLTQVIRGLQLISILKIDQNPKNLAFLNHKSAFGGLFERQNRSFFRKYSPF